MPTRRRDCLKTVAGLLLSTPQRSLAAHEAADGIPGFYRGKVIGVEHRNCIRDDNYQAEAITAMLSRGMCELTDTHRPADAWRRFFRPADVVGIKLNPVGQPYVGSSPEMLRAIIAGLQLAGVKLSHIVVYERYRENLESAGVPGWLPAGVRLASASPRYSAVQQDMEGYDRRHFVDLPFTLPGQDPHDPAATRSYAARFITTDVTKLINVPVLKTHNAAGYTLALKNLSHGLVNNVSRSHDGARLRLNEFIPAVVAMPVIRRKTVLTILDGTRGIYHGGPGVKRPDYVWEHRTIYVGTDPVAIDTIGKTVIEDRRREADMRPVKEAKTDQLWIRPERHTEHIQLAGQTGLGEWDPSKIDFQRVTLA